MSEITLARFSVGTCFFVCGAVVSTWVSRIPTIQHQLHLGSAGLGIAELGLPVGQVVAMQLVAGLVRRWTSATSSRWALAAACGSLVLISLAHSVVVLALALALFGVGLGALDTCMNTQAVELERRAGRLIMSSFHGIYSVGVLAGSLLGAIAAGSHLSPFGHFLAAAAVFVCVAGLGTRWLLDGDADRVEDGGDSPETAGPPRLRDHPMLIAVGLIAFCALFAEGAVENWSGVFLHQVRHASYGVAPYGVAATGIGMAIGRFSGDALIARWQRTRVLVASTALGIAGVALALLGGSVAASVAGYAVFGLGIASIVPIAFTVAGNTSQVPPAWAISRSSTMGYVGQLASPAIIGLCAQGVGLTAALALPILGLVLIVPVALILKPR